MNKDRVAGSAKKIKGSIKEVVGDAPGTLEVEGKADKGEGKVQNAVGGLKDSLKSTASTRLRATSQCPAGAQGGISECKPRFANKTCQAEPLAKAQRRQLSLNRRYQHTQRMMITRSKWRPLKRSSMLNMLVGFTAGLFCRQLCTASALCSRTGYKVFAPEPGTKVALVL
jgi:uncharacterized protein YjbJ (UPF0337 family)